MLKIAIIGLGRVTNHHIRAIGAVGGMTLVAGCDTRASAREELPEGVPFFQNHRELIEACDADVFVVATPPATHHDIAGDVLKSRRGLVLEKPATANQEELDGLLRLYEALDRASFFHIALHSAHGLETRWWMEHRRRYASFGPMTGFHASRHDPHICGHAVDPLAHAQIGPWLVSGINALSAIGVFIPPERMRIASSRMIGRGLVPNCAEVAASASIAFTRADGGLGLGAIDVDWTQSTNRKAVTLCYGNARTLVHLDDSYEAVRIVRDGREIERVDLANSLPRLTNQYVGVYQDVVERYRANKGNLDFAIPLHRLVFEACR